MAVRQPNAEYTGDGPLGSTGYGTKVKVVRLTGCGGCIVERQSDREQFPCHLSAITGTTPADQARILSLIAGSELAA